MTFEELHRRLQEAIRTGPRVIAEFLSPTGRRRVITEQDLEHTSGEEYT